MKWYILSLLCIGALFFCRCGSNKNKNLKFDETKYLAHLKLDSSILIVSEVKRDLNVPWEITLGPEGMLWFTEQKGTVSRLDTDSGHRQILLKIQDVYYKKSFGLLSMALYPDFDKHPYVYLHYTYDINTADQLKIIKSRLVRYTFESDTLIKPRIILDSIPGKTYHNGSRMIFTPDNKLLLATGDAGEKELAQDTDHLNGKILRMNPDGSIPDDNPFAGSYVWSYGHRNIQGLVHASNGKLYSSEHGTTNDDEINIIRKNKNYGWPYVEGYCDLTEEQQYCEELNIQEPITTWSPTIAGAGLDYYAYQAIPEWQNSLLLASLKGQALRVINLNKKGDEVIDQHIFLQQYFGRIRDLAVASNGDVYISTSNLDWHYQYQPWMYDSLPLKIGDRIIRLQIANSAMKDQLATLKDPVELVEDEKAAKMEDEVWDFEVSDDDLSNGKKLYLQYCASCHRPDGSGSEGLIPPIANTDWVTGDKPRLIRLTLEGLSEPIKVNGVRYEQEMPAFSYLSDEQLADMLTYIRKSFGNDADPIIPADVYEERKGV